MRIGRVGSAAALALAALLVTPGCAELMQAIETLPAPSGDAGVLDERTVADALREALEIGTDRSVTATSRLDGFMGNELIRIAIPPKAERATDTLRRLGFDRQVDELELGMNRAAERASAEARELFWDAIRQLTIEDAFAILRGEDDAATEYLRRRTGSELRARIEPIVVAKMDEVGLSRAYDRVVERIELLPLIEPPSLDLDAYVTDETLEGIFTMLAREERRIREEPVARTTELLRRVFG